MFYPVSRDDVPRACAFRLCTALCIVAIVTSGATAALSFNLDLCYAFNGAPPEGTPPWLNATFLEGTAPGTVDLVLNSLDLTSTEFVKGWYFNFDPLLDPTELVFSAPLKTGVFDDPTVQTNADGYKADGDGWHDILLSFSTEDSGMAHRFSAGDAVQYTISHNTASLTPQSFDYVSAPGGGEGVHPTVAHVLGIGGGDSGWVTIPEPCSIALLAAGSIALLARRRRT